MTVVTTQPRLLPAGKSVTMIVNLMHKCYVETAWHLCFVNNSSPGTLMWELGLASDADGYGIPDALANPEAPVTRYILGHGPNVELQSFCKGDLQTFTTCI